MRYAILVQHTMFAPVTAAHGTSAHASASAGLVLNQRGSMFMLGSEVFVLVTVNIDAHAPWGHTQLLLSSARPCTSL